MVIKKLREKIVSPRADIMTRFSGMIIAQYVFRTRFFEMKRFFTIILLFALLSSLLLTSACSSGEESEVHVFFYNYSDTYITSVRSALATVMNASGASFQNYDGNNNQTTQTEQIRTAITKGARVLLVNLVNTGSADAATTVVNEAKNAGVPVVFFNREVPDSVVNSYDKCAFVGTDSEEAGHLQGQMIGDYVKENFQTLDLNGDGEISYILFKGEEGNNEAIHRTRYAVEDANNILTSAGMKPLRFYDKSNANKYLVDPNGAWSAAAANQYMTTALASYNEANNNMIELVICNNDGMAEGAITALNTAGYNNGSGKSIPVFGVDATDAAKNLIASNKMTGTIKQDAEGMARALDKLAANALAGRSLLDGVDEFTVDEGVAKIRIPYEKYLG